MDELQYKEIWKKSAANAPDYSYSELESFLENSMKRSVSRLNKKLKIDYIISLLISILIIFISFIFSFQYKWIVLTATCGFNAILWVHFRLKTELLNRGVADEGGLLQSLNRKLRMLHFYRNLYRYGIPVFTALLFCLYFILFLPEIGLRQVGLVIVASIGTLLLVEILWKKMYIEHVHKMKTLKGICERLHDSDHQ